MSCGIKIRTVPSNANPTPRPSTSYSRPGTAARPSSSCGRTTLSIFNNIIDDETKSIFENVISEKYLLELYPDQNPSDLDTVSLVVDTTFQSLLDLGDIAPNLSKLYLDNSKLLSVRDLGTSLRGLQVLSLNNCGLTELDGIAVLFNLRCLYARDNLISDINALAMHEYIEELDLHGNKITDISIADILSSCSSLKKLYLTLNPISRAPNYRLIMAAMIPQIEFLDSTLVDHNAKAKISNGMILEAASAMQLEQEELDDEKRMEMAILGDEFNTAMGFLPNDYANDSESSQIRSSGTMFPDTGSDLTHGSTVVLAGNMAAAMRRRRQTTPTRENINTHEGSALTALDHALHNEVTEINREAHIPYFGEGDITSLVLNSGSPHFMGPRSPRPQKNQAHQLSTSFDAEIGSLDKDEDFSSTMLKGDETPFNRNSRSNSRGVSPSGLRSPSPARTRNGLPPSSPPIQLNASRPSSSRGNLTGGIASTPSAPFKIMVPSKLRDDDTIERSENGSILDKNEVISISKTLHDVWDVSDDSSDDEIIVRNDKRNQNMRNRCGPLKTNRDQNLIVRSSQKMPSEGQPKAFQNLTKASVTKVGAETTSSPPKTKMSNALSNMAGRSLGFDLRGSLAAINQWVEEMDSDDDVDDDGPGQNNISNLSSSNTKILSRDSIINMCIRGDETPINESEEIANTSEAYEENDVLFFDNYVHRSTESDYHLSHVEVLSKSLHQSDLPKLISPTNHNQEKNQETSVAGHHLSTQTSALFLSDETLITMLSLPPKSVPQMKTKSSFQDFFRGIPEERMRRLLYRAYGNLNDLEREVKVKKRMELLAGVLANV